VTDTDPDTDTDTEYCAQYPGYIRVAMSTVQTQCRSLIHAFPTAISRSSRFFLLRNGKQGSPYSITERRVPKLIAVLSSQPGRLPLLSARPAVTFTTLKKAAIDTNFAAQRPDGCEQF